MQEIFSNEERLAKEAKRAAKDATLSDAKALTAVTRHQNASSHRQIAYLQAARVRSLAPFVERMTAQGGGVGALLETLDVMARRSNALQSSADLIESSRKMPKIGLIYAGRITRDGKPEKGLKVMAYAPDGDAIKGGVPTKTDADGRFYLHLKKAIPSRLSILGHDDECLYRHPSIEAPGDGAFIPVVTDIGVGPSLPPDVPDRDPCAKPEAGVIVPKVEGQPLDEAITELKRAFLTPQRGVSTPSNIPEGHVLRQSEKAGTEVPKFTTVTVIPSQGEVSAKPEDIFVPDFTGLRLEQAKKKAVTATLKVASSGEIHSSEVVGTIARQAPEAGQKTKAGTRISVELSKGLRNDAIILPDVTGMDIDDAAAEIKRLRLAVKLGRPVMSELREQSVAQQSPSKGQEMKPGDIVTLYPVASDEVRDERLIMPDLRDRSASEAQDEIAAIRASKVNLRFKTGRGRSVILAQTPNPERQIQSGRHVELTLRLPKSWQKSRSFWLSNIFQFYPKWARSSDIDDATYEKARAFVADLDWAMVETLQDAKPKLSGLVEQTFDKRVGSQLLEALRYGYAQIEAAEI